ncbi:integrase core domain-containing protein, partial [Burkholderia pseudomallei]
TSSSSGIVQLKQPRPFSKIEMARRNQAGHQDYNEQRPHSALNYLAPSEFAAKHRATADAPAAFQELV